MLLVLDANEYIFALGLSREQPSEELLSFCIERFPSIKLRAPRTVVDEVRRNLSPRDFREFIAIVNLFISIDEDIFIPFELGAKYEAKGLKPADALIAAYTEWVGADALVSENRHFLLQRSDLSFRVLTAKEFLKFMGHSS